MDKTLIRHALYDIHEYADLMFDEFRDKNSWAARTAELILMRVDAIKEALE